MCVVGWSKSGKTNLIQGVLRALKARGWKVAAVKHHPHFEQLGPPGKDTTRFLEAGAEVTVLLGSRGYQITVPVMGGTLEPLLPFLSGFDLVIAEGFKGSEYPKIVVVGGSGEDPLYERLTNVIAVVGEGLGEVPFPCFSPGQVEDLASFIQERFLKEPRRVEVFCDGKAVPLNPFVKGLLHGVLGGIIRALKGCEGAGEVLIRWRSP